MARDSFKTYWEQKAKWTIAWTSRSEVPKDKVITVDGVKLVVDPTGSNTTWATFGVFDRGEDTTTVNRLEGPPPAKIYTLRRRVCLLCQAPGSGGIVWVAEEGG